MIEVLHRICYVVDVLNKFGWRDRLSKMVTEAARKWRGLWKEI